MTNLILFTKTSLFLLFYLQYHKVSAFCLQKTRLFYQNSLNKIEKLHSLNNKGEADLQTLSILKSEVEKRRNALITAEIAVLNMEKELQSFDLNTSGNIQLEAQQFPLASDVETEPPPGALILGLENFRNELIAVIAKGGRRVDKSINLETKSILKTLKLSNEAIWKREAKRPEIIAPLLIKIPYYLLCFLLDALFDGDPISRFWFLETVRIIIYTIVKANIFFF